MIELKNVSFRYSGGQTENGLSGINLTIKSGEVVLLAGESGCGKTTLTRLINGLIPNFYEGKLEGEVLVCGKNVSRLPLYETAALVGSVFQNPRSQFFNVDTTSELAFGCENMGIPEREINSRILKTVGAFKIEKLMNRSIFRLSGGEKQKIACAGVSVCQPEIFVLDEPSSNLDVRAIYDLKLCISEWKKKGKTVVIAEHRLYFLRELADRIIFMKNGCIESELSPREMSALTAFELESMGLRPFELKACRHKCIGKSPVHQLKAKNFRFSYKHGADVLCIDELEIPKNAVTAIIGNNGAGKSTFARCFCGLEKRCRGEIHNENSILKCKKHLKSCYLVMQDVNHQLFTESVLDEVLLSMKEQSTEKAEEILKSLDLLEMKELHPMSLSGGQKQRVAIASAVASQKEIIIFDEPTSGLDLKHMKEVAGTIKRLREAGKTILVITHDSELIGECCDHVIHLENGAVSGSFSLDDDGQTKLLSFFTVT
ncbi:MAG: energy-coupling factor ABC transporter ATP-binding protein [Oscillospiraceae bacterium]|jgi:energy-coupling factor transport system ATP-binding protein